MTKILAAFRNFVEAPKNFWKKNKLSRINVINISFASFSKRLPVQTTVGSEPIRNAKAKILFLPRVKSNCPDFAKRNITKWYISGQN